MAGNVSEASSPASQFFVGPGRSNMKTSTASKAGDIVIKAMDRTSGESRSFRLDRLVAYTVHRTAYTVPRPTVDAPSGHGLAAATPRVATLTPATITPAARIDALIHLLTTAA